MRAQSPVAAAAQLEPLHANDDEPPASPAPQQLVTVSDLMGSSTPVSRLPSRRGARSLTPAREDVVATSRSFLKSVGSDARSTAALTAISDPPNATSRINLGASLLAGTRAGAGLISNWSELQRSRAQILKLGADIDQKEQEKRQIRAHGEEEARKLRLSALGYLHEVEELKREMAARELAVKMPLAQRAKREVQLALSGARDLMAASGAVVEQVDASSSATATSATTSATVSAAGSTSGAAVVHQGRQMDAARGDAAPSAPASIDAAIVTTASVLPQAGPSAADHHLQQPEQPNHLQQPEQPNRPKQDESVNVRASAAPPSLPGLDAFERPGSSSQQPGSSSQAVDSGTPPLSSQSATSHQPVCSSQPRQAAYATRPSVGETAEEEVATEGEREKWRLAEAPRRRACGGVETAEAAEAAGAAMSAVGASGAAGSCEVAGAARRLGVSESMAADAEPLESGPREVRILDAAAEARPPGKRRAKSRRAKLRAAGAEAERVEAAKQEEVVEVDEAREVAADLAACPQWSFEGWLAPLRLERPIAQSIREVVMEELGGTIDDSSSGGGEGSGDGGEGAASSQLELGFMQMLGQLDEEKRRERHEFKREWLLGN